MTWNTLAASLATAREKGRAEVLEVVRAALPATEADHIESRVRELLAVPEASPDDTGAPVLVSGSGLSDGASASGGTQFQRSLTGDGVRT